MIFLEKLNSFTQQVEEALDELFNAASINQSHEQDLLLIEINGFYDKNLENNNLKLSPFVFGPRGWVYFANYTQYRFFDIYRRQMITIPRIDYFNDFDTDENKQLTYDFTLQIELMVFLKFWESDVILRNLYHLSNLAQGKNYDWHFNIKKDDSRHEIIRQLIRDPIQNICPKYFQLLKEIYLSQIRNAAAHTQFYIEGKKLGFTNYDPVSHAPLSTITFEEWEDRFHKLVLLYNGIIKRFNESLKTYVDQQEDKHFGLQIRLTKKDGTEKTQWIKYVDTGGRIDWMWYDNWKKYYRNR